MINDDYNDLTDVSGGPMIMGDYTASVFQHDASGFYNWQQDNIPLLDLQEREDFLFKMIGAPTSAVEGVSFVLSSTTGPTGTNIFSDIEDIVARLPKRITFPILIEICKYGDLGELQLEGITTERDGSLRIVNRLGAYAANANQVQTNAIDATYYDTGDKKTPHHVEGDWSMVFDASCETLNDLSIYDLDSWENEKKGYYMKAPGKDEDQATDFVYLDIESSTEKASTAWTDIAGTQTAYMEVPYDSNRDLSISAFDPNPSVRSGWGDALWQTAEDQVSARSIRRGVTQGGNLNFAIFFGNFFSKVTANNTSGKIILENILVDGALGEALSLVHTTANGFDLKNSSFALRNCMSIRNYNAGFRLVNSQIKVIESVCSARNYSVSAVGVDLLRSHHQYGDHNMTADTTHESGGFGFELINSQIDFDVHQESTNASIYPTVAFANSVGVSLKNSTVVGGFTGTDSQTTHLLTLFNNYDGLEASNSQVNYNGCIDSAMNGGNGVYLEDSTLKGNSFAVEDNQRSGVMAVSSRIVYGHKHNRSSRGTASSSLARGQFSFTNNGQNLTLLDNSSFKPGLPLKHRKEYDYTLLGTIMGEWTTSSTHHGTSLEYTKGYDSTAVDLNDARTKGLEGCIPGILVKDNSIAEILNLDYMAPSLTHHDEYPKGTAGMSEDYYASMAIYGHCVLADSNSDVILRGAGYTTALTSDFYADEADIQLTSYQNDEAYFHLRSIWTKSAACARRNSRLRISGPTKISRFGIGLQAEDYSTLEVLPHEYPFGDGDQADSSFYNNTTDSYETSLEVHSTRACIVVNNKSHWKCEYIGTTVNSADNAWNYNSGYNHNSGNCTDSGYIKFYPNPFTVNYNNLTGSEASPFFLIDEDVGSTTRGFDDAEDFDKTLGGMCVRAIGDSSIYINETDFKPTASYNAVSGAYYDINQGACQRPHLWNFGDTSRLQITNVTVSGTGGRILNDGSTWSYHGPSGTYDVTAISALYAAGGGGTTSEVGDTLEANYFLDDFGPEGRMVSGSNDESYKNNGIYRIMVGINPMAEQLLLQNTAAEGNVLVQLLSQGYTPWGAFPSFDATSDISYLTTSATPDVLQKDDYPVSATGGFIHDPFYGYRFGQGYIANPSFPFDTGESYASAPFLDIQMGARRTVDDSALQIFQNAKHLTQPHLSQLTVITTGNSYFSDEYVHSSSIAGYGQGVRSVNRFDLKRLT